MGVLLRIVLLKVFNDGEVLFLTFHFIREPDTHRDEQCLLTFHFNTLEILEKSDFHHSTKNKA